MSSKRADRELARIHREQWNDWKDRFLPRLEQLAGYAQSGELTQRDIDNADSAVTASFDQVRGSEQARQEGLGLQMTDRQRAASEREMGLNEAATRASMRNQARIAGEDRDMQILAGGGNIGLGL